ncbi:GGDEF domain-containing protein [bacterium]|nr:GGDEF domain-containing protein [bacterium]
MNSNDRINNYTSLIEDDYEEKTQIVEEKSLIKNLKNTKAYLIEIYGENLGKKTEIETDRAIIGREARCNIVINSNSVSRKHAMIYKKYIDMGNHNSMHSFWIRDLGSTNGTYVGDQPINDIELMNGDTIKVGSTIFKFIIGSDVETAYFEEIYNMTIVDGLTEIHNKRYFLESLEKEISRAKRYERPLCLIMFDIDFFKKINDTYGHLTGDYVLKKMSQVIRDSIRREEIFARYGGEEFAIIMPETPKKSAVTLAEKVRQLIETTIFSFEGHVVPVTISLGVADLNKSISSALELIAFADKNLYKAKHSGRNCVIG